MNLTSKCWTLDKKQIFIRLSRHTNFQIVKEMSTFWKLLVLKNFLRVMHAYLYLRRIQSMPKTKFNL